MRQFMKCRGTAATPAAVIAMAVLIAAAPAAGQQAEPAAGDDKRIETAMGKGLGYLLDNQLADGSFKSSRMPGNTGITSLGVMAFLVSGQVPGEGDAGQAIDRAIDYVLNRQTPQGLLLGPKSRAQMYSHCISTLMLVRASGKTRPARQKKISAALVKALGVIVEAQKVKKKGHAQGGWRYTPASGDSDISCTVWALAALQAARSKKFAVPAESIDQGVKYILSVQGIDGGFGYIKPIRPTLGRTGMGLACLELCRRPNDKAAASASVKAQNWILDHPPTNTKMSFFHYSVHHVSNGMALLGGARWKAWKTRVLDMVLKAQKPDGSWPADRTGAGLCYTTALSVLTLSTFRAK